MPFSNGIGIYSFGFEVVPPNIVDDLAVEVVGTPTIQVGGGRFGRNCVRLTSSASDVNWTLGGYRNGIASGAGNSNRLIASLYVRYKAKPTVSGTSLFSCEGNAGNIAHVFLNTVSGYWEIQVVGGTAVNTGINPMLNTWYRFDVIYRMDLNPRTFEVRITIDGEATNIFSGTATGGAEAATNGHFLRLGQDGASTQTVEFDDILMSGSATDGDFPITPQGKHHMTITNILGADGTHSVGTGTFRFTWNNGSSYTNITNGTTDSYEVLAWVPAFPDGDSADRWVEKSAGTTLADMVEWVFYPMTEISDPIGVHVHATVRNASGVIPNSVFLYLRKGTTDASIPIQSGDIGSATKIYRGCCYSLAPDGSDWTLENLNALKIRFSADDVSSIPRIKSINAEVTFQYEVKTISFPTSFGGRGAA